jgi:hypothetical protein
MKTILILIVFLSNILFADYNTVNQDSEKIDMHGGNEDKLINKKNSLQDINLNNINNKLKSTKEPEREKLEEDKIRELKDLGL